MPDVALLADSTTAAPMSVEELNPDQRNDFFKTGKLPVAEPPAPPEEKPAEEAKGTEAEPAKENAEVPAKAGEPESQTGKPDGKPLTREEKTSVRFEETRQRLQGEVTAAKAAEDAAKKEASDLRKQLDEALKKGAPPAPPAAAPKVAEAVSDPEPIEPEQPTEDQFSDDEFPKYEAAMEKYKKDQKQYLKDVGAWSAREEFRNEKKRADQAAQEASVAATKAEQEKQWMDRVKEATARHPDWDKVALASDDGGKTFKVQMNRLTDVYVLESPIGADILYYLASEPQEAARIAGITNDIQCARELFKLEQQIEKTLKDSKVDPPPATEPAKAPPSPPSHRPPADIPTELSGTQGGGSKKDPAADAIARQDVGEYMRLKNAEDLALRQKKRG